MNVPTDLLSSIGICVGFAALIAAVTWRFRQPLIIAYLATGVIIGPIGLGFIKDQSSISTVAEIGLILLLFVIGLEIDLRKMAAGGAAVLLTGALQVPICVALGLAFFYLFGVQNGPHDYALLYLAACMSLSSTLVVVKILNDKFELDTLPGRITLGVLVIQDLWAVAMLAVQPNLVNPNLVPLLGSLWRGALLVVGGFAISKYVLPHLFRMVAKAPELVLVSALGWCFFLAGAASLIGLSREMGALIAGVSLSTFPYNYDVVAKAVSIRDFFVTLFFVALGMQITIPSLKVLELALVASAFVIVSRVVVVPILYALRLGLRTSIVPAINLAQVSEFSIVIASLGVTLGQIKQDVLTIVIITFALTSVVSTYMINFSHRIQAVLTSVFKALGLKDLDAGREEIAEDLHQPVIFLGFFRDTSSILYEFEHEGTAKEAREFVEKILVIDFNPTVLRELRRKKIKCIYGDIAHSDTLRHAGVEHATLVVSSITDDVLRGTSNLRLMKTVHNHAPDAHVVLTTEHIPQALHFYEEGADFVFIPRLYSAAACARILRKGLAGGFAEVRSQAIEHLSQRQEVLA
ncbi:MAG TPA: cation:proton antiporter [Candidatus Dormibacteraeota bacterium]|jgi:Kef-type K+ transport system membrane component KefB|nr:cation:proton antiporter [Candidatus Dormibacteraeota bacterium]